MHLDPTTATAAALHAAIDDALCDVVALARRAAVAGMTGSGEERALLAEIAALQRRVTAYSAELAGRAMTGRAVRLTDLPGELR